MRVEVKNGRPHGVEGCGYERASDLFPLVRHGGEEAREIERERCAVDLARLRLLYCDGVGCVIAIVSGCPCRTSRCRRSSCYTS